MMSTPLHADRLDRCKRAYTTRAVPIGAMRRLLGGGVRPEAGDLLLARVERLGQHYRLEDPAGRRSTLYPGDEIVVCYGHRYATDQFEAEVPDGLGPCDLVAGGGVAARSLGRCTGIRSATTLTPLGLLAGQDGQRLNLRDWALPATPDDRDDGDDHPEPLTVAVLGTSMNAGKTTTAADCIRALTLAGRRVAAVKATGTGSGGDTWQFLDAGAHPALDVTAAGHVSTYKLDPQRVTTVFEQLVGHARGAAPDVIVVEVADGVLQTETAALLHSPTFARVVDTVLFACADPLGAVGGVSRVREAGLRVAAVSGALTASPLAMREAAAALQGTAVCGADDPELLAAALHGPGVPVLDRDALTAGVQGGLLDRAAGRRRSRPVTTPPVGERSLARLV